jgi:hypothetical protein
MEAWSHISMWHIQRALDAFTMNYPNAHLVWLVPCKDQDDKWTCRYEMNRPSNPDVARVYQLNWSRIA